MYKFEVYRNPNDPLSSSQYNDGVRYFESLYVFERTIKPTWNDLSLDDKKDNGRFFFRRHLGGEFKLIGDDFDWANTIRQDASERNIYRLLYIKELKDGVWETIWTGFLSIVDGEFDLARCFVTFSDLLVFDKYSVVLENIDKEYNLIDVATAPVNYEIHTYEFDVEVETSQVYYGITQCLAPTLPSFCNVSASEHFPDETEKWTLFSKKTRYAGQEYNGAIWSWVYTIMLEYRRDYVWASSNPDVAKWVEVESGDTLNKYVRHYKNMDSLSFDQVQYSKLILNEDTEEYCKFRYTDNNVILPSDLVVENTRARTLSAAIYHLINQLSTISEYESLFFEGVTNPITEAANRLNYVVLFQLSDMKPTSDPATIGMYSFKDIESWIRIFECGWYIDDNNFLKIEHRKYFDLGLSYSGNSVGLDISGDKMTVGKKVISYVDSMPQIEEVELAYSNGSDFVGLPIIYHGNIVNRRGDASVESLGINNLATDLTYVTSNEDEIGNDGFFMAACSLDDGVLNVAQTNGLISTSIIWNGYLSVANLMYDYWRWGRSITKGVMNNYLTEFTAKDLVLQEDIIVVECDDIDPYKLVKTSYGDGNIIAASRFLKDKRLVLSLSYDV